MPNDGAKFSVVGRRVIWDVVAIFAASAEIEKPVWGYLLVNVLTLIAVRLVLKCS